MKKLSFVLCLCLLLSVLAGCSAPKEENPEETYALVEVQPLEGEPATVDTEGLEEYTMACGLRFYGPKGLKEEETEAMAGYM